MDNQKISQIFKEISLYLQLEEQDFKARAYENAALLIENLDKNLVELYQTEGLKGLENLKGIGKSLALKIEELIQTGKLVYLNQLKEKYPIDLQNLLAVEGLGPKKIRNLYLNLGIKNLDDLKKAVEKGLIRNLKGFGLKSEKSILKALSILANKRFILAFVEDEIISLKKKLISLEGVKQVEIAGSFRRKKETIGDVDILISLNEKYKKDFFKKFLNLVSVKEILVLGKEKLRVKLENGLEIDLRIIKEENFGSALLYFTGSKAHNIVLRKLAISKGFKLNEYGLFDKNNKKIASKTEEEIYQKLGLNFIEPELREDTGEFELNHKLPKLLKRSDLLGDLQIQSDYSDGLNTIWELAKKAIDLNLKYIAITDHSKSLRVANGLDEKRFKKQWQEIDKLNLVFKRKNIDFKILKGVECEILKNGELDFKDEFLKNFDIVGAAIHSYFNLPIKEQTERLKKAMKNKFVNIIFHPTGRLINKRAPYEVDIFEIIETAKNTKTILEVNAYPDRLDLTDQYVRKCVDLGVKLSVDSDSHQVNHLDYLIYGVYQARRGWAKKTDIINCLPLEKMLKIIKK